jgi:hypothetical protein
MYLNRGLEGTQLNEWIGSDILKSNWIDMVPNLNTDMQVNAINNAQLNEWLGLDFINTIQPDQAAYRSLSQTFQPDPQEVEMQIQQIHARQCEILMQCIHDINTNAKKHHVQFMLSIINNGTLRDIERISNISHSQAKRLHSERKRGIYKEAMDLTRAGLSKTGILKLVRQNS